MILDIDRHGTLKTQLYRECNVHHYARYISSADERHEDEETIRHCVGCVMPIICLMLSFPSMCTVV